MPSSQCIHSGWRWRTVSYEFGWLTAVGLIRVFVCLIPQADIFQEYIIKEDAVGFQVNLTVLLDCLTIFGGSTVPGVCTALRMCYNGYGYPLTLFLEEGGVVTVCKINTQEPEEPIDFDFCSTNVTNKVILQSDSLKEAFSELDMTSEVLQITMSPSHPYFRCSNSAHNRSSCIVKSNLMSIDIHYFPFHFRLSTFGNSGNAHYDYPKDSDMMELFQCTKIQTNRYKMSLLKPSTKALALSCKVSVRTDSRGFLSLQYLVRNDDGQICFVEYYCCPDEEVEEE
uniref:Cell cycle checkpoint protein RAD1-like n=1 Tax=Sinocyclocheilus grahami TaxID=75366 RepID=A0A672RF41_SINGR